jgi:hypothetical protein
MFLVKSLPESVFRLMTGLDDVDDDDEEEEEEEEKAEDVAGDEEEAYANTCG